MGLMNRVGSFHQLHSLQYVIGWIDDDDGFGVLDIE